MAGFPLVAEPFPADTVAVLPNLGPGFGTNLTGSARLYHLDTWTKESVVTVGMPIDQHEILSLPNGDRMALSYPLRSGIDLTGLPNCNITQPSTAIADCAVQELDPAGNLVWQWRASDHIDPVLESTTQGTTTVNICSGGSAPDANCQGNCSGGGTCTGAGNTCVGGTNPGTVCCPGGGTCSGQKVCDVYHCNSIDVNAAGDVLVSARHTDSVFLIKRATGQCPAGGDCIVWKLGSTRPNTDGAQILTILNDPQTTFYRQHDARFRPNGNISVFDDHGAGLSTAKARGVEYQLDLGAGTAQPVWQYLGDAKSNAGGSARRYPDGHSVIDWGLSSSTSNVAFTEIDDASGLDVLDLSFASHGNWGYRAVKVPLDAFDITRLRNTAGLPEP